MTTVSFDINNENTTHNGTGYQEATASSTPTYAAVFSHAYSVFFCHHRLPPIDLRATTPPMTIINQPSRQIAARLISASARLHGYASRQALFISTASGRSPHWTKYERHRSGHHPKTPTIIINITATHANPTTDLPGWFYRTTMEACNSIAIRKTPQATARIRPQLGTLRTLRRCKYGTPNMGKTTGTDHTGWPTMGRYETKSLNVR